MILYFYMNINNHNLSQIVLEVPFEFRYKVESQILLKRYQKAAKVVKKTHLLC